ncbi:MAG: maleylpyruvate isomerase N-terminal domain-containing protein [Mycobacterium sp.]|uniref:maleylpyruvate isomerase N-terminal domain-containing protein n=1 Tax=Mycobacterium sp. TaxID=1785 RepID=UPI001EC3F81D|nr:maleylpyruvate isomerase N-terminal domain-containing protein [Mycobacterium sp.]MBV8788432.1 maleylpyruvate isomerase N-terminal domain-containing protein [Mycobacterium sp.]
MTNQTSGVGRPQLRSGAEAVAAYRTVHRRVDALTRDRADACERSVPACPKWSVRQTVSHLTGTAQDMVALNLEQAGTDAWTQAQLDRLADLTLEELLELWSETIDAVAELLMQIPKLSAAQAIFDALTHEHDIRGALDEPGSRTADPAFAVSAGFLTTMVDRAIRRNANPFLRLSTPTTGTIQLGDPARSVGQIAVELSDFEALRVFGGRRSYRQLQALPWDGDAAPLLPLFDSGVVRPPTGDLIE